MTLLESSGIVDFAALPAAPAPGAAATGSPAPDQVLSSSSVGAPSTVNVPLVLAALAAGLGAGVFATRQVVRNRRPAYRSRRPRYYGG